MSNCLPILSIRFLSIYVFSMKCLPVRPQNDCHFSFFSFLSFDFVTLLSNCLKDCQKSKAPKNVWTLHPLESRYRLSPRLGCYCLYRLSTEFRYRSASLKCGNHFPSVPKC